MTSIQTPIVPATTAAVVATVVAVVLLLVSVASSLVSDWAGRAGLACLFAAPVVRNVVVAWHSRGSLRWLAILGVVVVAVVFYATFGQALDPTHTPLPTSTK
jgi:hypothetical protein